MGAYNIVKLFAASINEATNDAAFSSSPVKLMG